MKETNQLPNRSPLRAFSLTSLLLGIILIMGAFLYATRYEIPLQVAIPVALAFLLEALIYLVPGFPEVLSYLRKSFPKNKIASMVLMVSIAPYLIYSIPTGVFSLVAAVKLTLFCGFIAWWFVLVKSPEKGLSLSDLVVLAVLAYPMISGMTTLFRDIYIGPHSAIPRLDILGKLMLIPLGAITFLLIRGVSATGFRFKISPVDLKIGIQNYIFFLVVGLPIALGIGFIRWSPIPIDDWTYLLSVLGNILGIYLVVGLGEELYFRGLIQNLLTQRGLPLWVSQLISSILFGAAHLGRRGFPNWKYGAIAAMAGWFYGRAYSTRNSVPAAAVTHTLVVVTWRYLFDN
ncbi:MAG: hypothetical protein CMN58_06195 [Solibacterales bacterium]|nr:hypothetical protein [Bryobacterales bacterium]|tara:strand:- start:24 stop:1061 length:1038 start_codon:yes stop_codon:yes gene_type:complete